MAFKIPHEQRTKFCMLFTALLVLPDLPMVYVMILLQGEIPGN